VSVGASQDPSEEMILRDIGRVLLNSPDQNNAFEASHFRLGFTRLSAVICNKAEVD
jgi:hypothetical protein